MSYSSKGKGINNSITSRLLNAICNLRTIISNHDIIGSSSHHDKKEIAILHTLPIDIYDIDEVDSYLSRVASGTIRPSIGTTIDSMRTLLKILYDVTNDSDLAMTVISANGNTVCDSVNRIISHTIIYMENTRNNRKYSSIPLEILNLIQNYMIDAYYLAATDIGE